MKSKLKKLGLVMLSLTLSLAIMACSEDKPEEETNDTVEVPEEETEDTSEDTVEETEDNETKEDNNEPQGAEDYTRRLKEEKEILDGQVYVQDGMVIATMKIKEDVSDQDAVALAEKYAKDLKETFNDKKINVQAVKDGENIANIELD